MVTTKDSVTPTHTHADAYNRITLPKHFSNRIAWLRGSEVTAWLLLLAPGRHRLLSDEDVQSDSKLEAIRTLILEAKPAILAKPTDAQDPKEAAIVARLVPVDLTLHSHGQSWRLTFPKELTAYAKQTWDVTQFSILLSPEGYWEVWYKDALGESLTTPLSP